MLRKALSNFEEYMLVVSLIFSLFLIFIQIIMRYSFQSSLVWSEELVRYIFLWQIWLGASYAVKEHKHLRIEIINVLLPKKMLKYVQLCVLFLWFAFAMFLTLSGTNLVLKLFDQGQVSAIMGIPMAYPYASVPLGCALMSIRLIVETYRTVKNWGVSGI